MRMTPWLLAEPYRIQTRGYKSSYGEPCGAFEIPYPQTGVRLRVLAVSGEASRINLGDMHAWDHVSVSLPRRTPNWAEMSFIKSLFWDDDEYVMQLHVPASEHVNFHAHTLHLWKPILIEIPRPPRSAV